MNNDELAKMVEMAKGRAGWHVSKYEDLPAVLDEKEWLVACDVQRENAHFIAQAPAIIVALAEELATLKAAANRMAVAIRSAKSNAVYDSAFDDGDGNEYPVFAIDSDYVHSLYRALDDYERPKQEVK